MAGNKDAGSPSSGCLVVVHTASYRSMQCLCESSVRRSMLESVRGSAWNSEQRLPGARIGGAVVLVCPDT